ncbi:Na+/H+ antiporter subunit D [Jeotgalibacillus proteolyticus]|uniref:Na+/H+ antiporter subunit D n=1 Tax=Jeotgalibacillus proteolyticus TaxID=2082395 RepID=A0A2S5GAT5_9BACL|nr:Na+/H+ antiporter subunit D [Jeotgalibacillus proteolyticus]PPA70003.1 Na+/H+ antiporter subunit D [Jeotgalibacillus proteolyticus]
MINLPLLPILIPLLAAVILMLFPKHIAAQRVISIVTAIATIIASAVLVAAVKQNGILTVNLGSWPAPYGIPLVSDMLSALLVLTTSIIVLFVLWYAIYYSDREYESYFFYISVLFLLVGLNGAFTTGDIFNLFVFFEVFLISSYLLIVLGGKKGQLRESIKYVLINVISSALFVAAVAYLYAVVGSLNMADISQRIEALNEPGIISVIGIFFLIVFGLKGAIFPLYFWLPGSYHAPPIPVLALFGALLTKVGIYAIMRTFSLFFYQDGGYVHIVLGALALLTVIIGSIGALAYRDVKMIIIYNIIIAVGVILYGVAVMTPDGLEGAIFYLLHDMVIKAALFLLVGIMMAIAGSSHLKDMGGMIRDYPWIGWTYFIGALSLAGIPPLSGFIGKLLIVRGGFAAGDMIGPLLILISSLVVLYSAMKIFTNGFWGTPREYHGAKAHLATRLWVPAAALILIAIAYGVGAEAVRPFITQAVEPLVNPAIYIDAVLKE